MYIITEIDEDEQDMVGGEEDAQEAQTENNHYTYEESEEADGVLADDIDHILVESHSVSNENSSFDQESFDASNDESDEFSPLLLCRVINDDSENHHEIKQEPEITIENEYIDDENYQSTSVRLFRFYFLS